MNLLKSISFVAMSAALAACGTTVGGRDSGVRVDGSTDVPTPNGDPCIGPGGQAIARGTTQVVGPCNATCSCSNTGQLSCQPGECPPPPPPPGGCTAPDGTTISVGGRWASMDGCTQCTCNMPGEAACAINPECPPPPPPGCGGVVCEGGQVCCEATGMCYDPRCLACCMEMPPPPPPPPPPNGCNMVPPPARNANFVVTVGAPPNATGGSITDGLYTLTTAVFYTRPGGPQPPIMQVGAAVQVTGAGANWAIASTTNGMVRRVNYAASYIGSNLSLNATCGGGGRTGATYTARPTGFDMIINDPSAAIMYQFNR